MPQPSRSLPLLVGAVVIATLAWCWALGAAPVEDRPAAAAPASRDPSGRRLYLLIIDSLALSDLAHLPALRALGEGNFAATVQPCTDNFTTSCVKEALTGRSRESLFSLLENFGVLAPPIGANLVEDARAQGLRTALLSAGNLGGWSQRVDVDIRVDAEGQPPERKLALATARDFDIVVHHWIWLDVASHHSLARPKRYRKAQANTDSLVAALAAGLPADMDLIVTGDHGHAADGRHIEGLDTPTHVVVRSPNVRAVQPTERIPVSAVRTLAGLVTGLWDPQMRAPPGATGWVAAGVRLPSAAPPSAPATARLGPLLLATALVVVLVARLLPSFWVALLLVWSALSGALYQPWVHFISQRGDVDDFQPWTWLVPLVVGGALWARTRQPTALARGAAWGGVALLLALVPGLARYAVLPNLTGALLPGQLLMALLLWRARELHSGWGSVLAQAAVGMSLLTASLAFDTNNFRIERLPFRLSAGDDWLHPLAAGLMGGVAGWLLGRRPALVVAGVAAVGWGLLVPSWLQAATTSLLLLLLLVGPPLLVGLLALATSGAVLSDQRQAGVLALVVGLALCWPLLRAQAERPSGAAPGPLSPAAEALGALALLVGAYAGLAWTMGLTVAGINFNFALPWFPERWHVRLWWLVALLMLLKMLLPTVLLAAAGAVGVGAAPFRPMLHLATRLALLRVAASLCFVAAYVWTAAPSLGSSRLRGLVFDGLGWLLIAVALLGLWFRMRPGEARQA